MLVLVGQQRGSWEEEERGTVSVAVAPGALSPPLPRHRPLALDGAELVTLGEAEWVELRLEVDGLGWNERTLSARAAQSPRLGHTGDNAADVVVFFFKLAKTEQKEGKKPSTSAEKLTNSDW